MSKIPQELRLLLSRYLSGEWDLEGLLYYFGEELNLREKCALAPIGGPATSATSAMTRLNVNEPRGNNYYYYYQFI